MVDMLLIGFLLLALLWGWHLGTIRVLAGLGAIIVAYQLARLYSAAWAAQLTDMLPHLDAGSKEGQLMALLSLLLNTDALANRLVQIILFIVIFVVAHWLIRKLAHLLTGLFGRGLLGAINRAVGAFLAGLLAAALLLIIHAIVLPSTANLGLEYSAIALHYLNKSSFMLPLLYSAPLLLSV